MTGAEEKPSPLITAFNFGETGDDVYEALLKAHEDLPEGESHRLNARLVLILANHIGDKAVLEAAMAIARSGVEPAAPDSEDDPE